MFEVYKKELLQIIRNKRSFILLFIAPIALILLMSYSFSGYMNYDTKLFEDGKVYYYLAEDSSDKVDKLMDCIDYISVQTNVTFEEVFDYKQAQESVKKQEAYGIISITDSGFDYYRSPFNETDNGKLLRSLIVNKLAITENTSNSIQIQNVILPSSTVNSNTYFTFSELSFIMLYIAFIIETAFNNEHESGTLQRINVSKLGIFTLMLGKTLVGLTMGIGQIIEVYIFSSLVLGVKWGKYTLLILLVLVFIALFSTMLGVTIGYIVKDKSKADNIILSVVILIAIMGGSLIPLSALQSYKAIQLAIKISPLYWSNKAIMNLYTGNITDEFGISLVVCGVLVVCFAIVCSIFSKKGVNKK